MDDRQRIDAEPGQQRRQPEGEGRIGEGNRNAVEADVVGQTGESPGHGLDERVEQPAVVDREIGGDEEEDALRQRVILTTPTSFIALLRAVAYGWRQEQLAANAERIREVGEELYRRLAVFAEHLGKVGKGLDSAVDCYNKAVGSFETKVLPGARRFTELGVGPTKALEEPMRIEVGIRKVGD